MDFPHGQGQIRRGCRDDPLQSRHAGQCPTAGQILDRFCLGNDWAAANVGGGAKIIFWGVKMTKSGELMGISEDYFLGAKGILHFFVFTTGNQKGNWFKHLT